MIHYEVKCRIQIFSYYEQTLLEEGYNNYSLGWQSSVQSLTPWCWIYTIGNQLHKKEVCGNYNLEWTESTKIEKVTLSD